LVPFIEIGTMGFLALMARRKGPLLNLLIWSPLLLDPSGKINIDVPLLSFSDASSHSELRGDGVDLANQDQRQ